MWINAEPYNNGSAFIDYLDRWYLGLHYFKEDFMKGYKKNYFNIRDIRGYIKKD